MADVEQTEVSFLWYPYIPIGKLTILDGDPNVGKTYFAISLIADLSRGKALPGQDKLEPIRVLICSVEDDVEDTIAPRLQAAGADLKMIDFCGEPFHFSEEGIAMLRRAVRGKNYGFIVFDPLVSYVGSGTDMHRANEIRPILSKLCKLANDKRIAVLGIRHLTKSGRDKAIYRGQGNIDIIAAARSAIAIGHAIDEDSEKALVHVKHNLSDAGPTRLFELCTPKGSLRPVLVWRGVAHYGADELLVSKGAVGRPPDQVYFAQGFLMDLLSDGPLPATEVKKAAEIKSISESTLNRAKESLNIQSKKAGKIWMWKLPGAQDRQNS